MENEDFFRTKEGFCQIYEGNICFLGDDKMLKNSSKFTMNSYEIIYSIIFVAICFYWFQNKENLYISLLISVMLLSIGVKYFYRLYAYPRVNTIAMSDLISAKYKVTSLGRIEGFFVIKYVNSDNKKRYKRIDMPIFEDNGGIEIKRAKALFEEHGLNLA